MKVGAYEFTIGKIQMYEQRFFCYEPKHNKRAFSPPFNIKI